MPSTPKPDSNRPRLLVMPDDGVEPIIGLIATTRRSILAKQFEMLDERVTRALLDAHQRGVSVMILLNQVNNSGERPNEEAFAQLQASGITVQWANPNFSVSHEKSMVFDGERALIATFNATLKSFTIKREYGVVVSDPVQVSEISACFHADWDRREFVPHPNSGLLWGGQASRQAFADVIDQTKRKLLIQHLKFVDAALLDRLVRAQMRGVKIQFLCGGDKPVKDYDYPETMAAYGVLKAVGVKLRRQRQPKLHAKLLVSDEHKVVVGSINLHRSAFDSRRELSLISEDKKLVERLMQVFDADWGNSKEWTPPDPLVPRAVPIQPTAVTSGDQE